jgi:hypothetical protein
MMIPVALGQMSYQIGLDLTIPQAAPAQPLHEHVRGVGPFQGLVEGVRCFGVSVLMANRKDQHPARREDGPVRQSLANRG